MRALLTGITGQVGSYLSELLLSKGYEVYGVIRRCSNFNTNRINHIYDKVKLYFGDLSDEISLYDIIKEVKPNEIYNLGAMSHVKVSFEIPIYTTDINYVGVLKLLNACKKVSKSIKIYQASSSEMFGNSPPMQSEDTKFNPQSPYAIAKVAAYHLTKLYRESYGMFICNGILFNHESPRRGETFVTKKITKAVARIKYGLQEKVFLGNLEARRDWGYAKEYVEAIWKIMQQDKPDDFVIATGETHSIQEFCEEAFKHVDLCWKEYVEISEKYKRPKEVNVLHGDSTKARLKFGWNPKVKFKELVKIMVEEDVKGIKL